jgi:NADPH:quinone reductase-like Zn-dependent oxidoreductase
VAADRFNYPSILFRSMPSRCWSARLRLRVIGVIRSLICAAPRVPGIDGVGRAPDGTLRYFILPETTMGAMAEQTVVDLRRSVALPSDSDPVLIAAAMNPAMSSWIALRRRITFRPGQRVLILGATGNAGRMAVQVAKRLGASQVIGAGRQPERLAALTDLGADATVSLDGPAADVAQHLGQAARHVDVVVDYLWGQATAEAMAAVVVNRTDRGQPLTWIEIGSVAGPTAAVPSAALRAVPLQIVGSGQGSVPAPTSWPSSQSWPPKSPAGPFR